MSEKNPEYDLPANQVAAALHPGSEVVTLTMTADAAEWLRLAMHHHGEQTVKSAATMPDSLKDIFLAEGNWLVENSKTIARTSAPVFHERDARQAAALAGYVGCLCDNCVDSLVAAKEGSKS